MCPQDSLSRPTLPPLDAQPYQPQFVPLPNDSVVANYQLPQTRGDILEMQERLFRVSCTALGCPPDMVMSQQGRSHATAVESAGKMMSTTISIHRERLTRMFIDIYQLFFGEDVNIDVIFPATQELKNMQELYGAGVLTYDAYKHFVCMHMGLTKRQLEVEVICFLLPPPPPLSLSLSLSPRPLF